MLDTDADREEVADPPLLLSWDAEEGRAFATAGLLEFDSIELLIWLGMVWVDEEEYPELISPLKWNPVMKLNILMKMIIILQLN